MKISRGSAEVKEMRGSSTRLPPAGSNDARRELVRRVVHSSTFARSERLGTFLTYVCELTLKGGEAEINEQRIGQAVFGRPQDYDSAVDGIVRSQASRLRQRLDLYFQQDGADEPVRITIPRGGYVPVFEAHSTAASNPPTTEPNAPASDTTPTESTQTSNKRAGIPFVPRWVPWGVSLFLGLLLITLWFHDRRGLAPATTAAHPFWGHLFVKDQSTLVVAPDSGLVIFRNMSGHDVDLNAYMDAGYRSRSNGADVGSAVWNERLIDLANRRYTSMVDLSAILNLDDRARTLGSRVAVRYARDLRPDDFKNGNTILLGSSAADPWVTLFEKDMDFVLQDNPAKTFSVLNRNPQKGEPARWESASDDPERRVFGLVAYLPGLAGKSNALIIEGATMSGTEAAMDFLADDSRLLPFLDRIRRPDGTLPHFEVLLVTKNTGSSAARGELLAWRSVK